MRQRDGRAKTLLRDVSGAAGQRAVSSAGLCALMGASGSGKSTLLDVLAGERGSREGRPGFN